MAGSCRTVPPGRTLRQPRSSCLEVVCCGRRPATFGSPMEWKEELSNALGLEVKLKQYNCPADDTVRGYCDTSSVKLFERPAETHTAIKRPTSSRRGQSH